MHAGRRLQAVLVLRNDLLGRLARRELEGVVEACPSAKGATISVEPLGCSRSAKEHLALVASAGNVPRSHVRENGVHSSGQEVQRGEIRVDAKG